MLVNREVTRLPVFGVRPRTEAKRGGSTLVLAAFILSVRILCQAFSAIYSPDSAGHIGCSL